MALGRETRGDAVRLHSRILWEDCGRPPELVFIESPLPWGEDLEPRPDAFLLACVVPAMDHGERRVQVEGAYCPELAAGLAVAFRVLHTWFPECTPPVLECTAAPRSAPRRTPPRVASFMSAGVDALATLRANRLQLPRDHPGAIRDCLCVFGVNSFEFADGVPAPARLDDFRARLARLQAVAADAGVELIPVVTNLRFLAPDYESWQARGHGAGLAATAHAFGRRVTRALIASGGVTALALPNGSHRLLDPHYSSASVEIRTDGLAMTRIEKTALVAEWPAGLAVVQPCLKLTPLGTRVNCGQCRKCVRTMIQLAALGALDRATVFPRREVTADMIAAFDVADHWEVDYLQQTLEPLERAGRIELAKAVRERLRRYASDVEGAGPVGWRARCGKGWRRIRRAIG